MRLLFKPWENYADTVDIVEKHYYNFGNNQLNLLLGKDKMKNSDIRRKAIKTVLESIGMQLLVFEYQTVIVREVATGEIYACREDELERIPGMPKSVFFNVL